MKILFLDIDGVLNSGRWEAEEKPADFCDVDPVAVARLQAFVARTNVQVILTSTWRLVPELVAQLRDRGVPIDGFTPRLNAFGTRSAEIESWLAEHDPNGTQVERFAIVDDDPDAGYGDLAPHFVQTTMWDGLTDRDVDRLAVLLET